MSHKYGVASHTPEAIRVSKFAEAWTHPTIYACADGTPEAAVSTYTGVLGNEVDRCKYLVRKWQEKLEAAEKELADVQALQAAGKVMVL